MQAAKRVAKNTGILYAKMGITVFISLYSTKLFLIALGAEDFGIFNVVSGAIALLGFLNASMAAATQRFMSYAQGEGNMERLKIIFNVSVRLHLIIALAVFVLLQGAGYFFFHGVLNISEDRIYAAKLIYQFMIVSTLFTVISVPYDAAINAHENMFLFAILGIVESVVKLMIALYINQDSGDRLITYGILMASLSVFLLLLRVFYCQKEYRECKIVVTAINENRLKKEMISFAGWSLMSSSASMIAVYGQGILINIFFGTILNAAQGIASQISGQLGTFATTMQKALNPVITKSEGAGDRALTIKASMLGSKLSFFLLMMLFVPVVMEMPYILRIWLKEVPPYTVIFCQLLLVRNLIDQLFITLATSISAVGRIRNFKLISSTLYCFPLLVSYWLFRIGYPPNTLYVVFIVHSILASVNILYFSWKNIGFSIKLFLKDVLLRCCFSLIICMAILMIPGYTIDESFSRLIITVACNVPAYLIVVWFIGLSKQERAAIRQIVKNILKAFLVNRSKAINILRVDFLES